MTPQDLKKNKRKVTKKDIEAAKEKLKSDPSLKDKLKGAFIIIRDFINMSWDYVSGDYPDIPLSSFLAISFAIIYFVSPIDLIPDAIPVLGLSDDALVINLAYDFVKDDVIKWREWKKSNKAA